MAKQFKTDINYKIFAYVKNFSYVCKVKIIKYVK